MGYYIRILGKADPDIHLDELVKSVEKEGLSAKFAFDPKESPEQWTVVAIADSNGNDLMQIERNPVLVGELGHEELEEFREIIKEYKPASAAAWLNNYFNDVKVIYAFQLLNNAFDDAHYPIVAAVRLAIWKKTGGILQADNEGFTNEDGYHILWQFSDDVSGEWSMAILASPDKWITFTMDLGDENQKREFQSGKFPETARLITSQ